MTDAYAGALALHRAGRRAEAAQAYKLLLRAQPNHLQGRYGYGVLLAESGDFAEAAKILKRLAKDAPGNAAVRYSLGKALQQQGLRKEALESFRLAAKLQPDYREAWLEIGNTLLALGDAAGAEALFADAAVRFPDAPEFPLQQGLAALTRRDLDRAADILRALAERRPDFQPALYNLGRVERERGDVAAAAEWFGKALRLKPDYAPALNHLGQCLKELWDLEGGLAAFEEAARLKSLTGLSNLLMNAHYSERYGTEQVARLHRQFGDAAGPLPPVPPRPQRRRGRIAVGLVSGDFARHPVGYMLLAVIEALDRGAFALHFYSNRREGDAVTAAFKALADGWHDVVDWDDAKLAKQIQRDGVELLIDLSGHTARHRLGIFARRPAPVQASGFGYFDTTGLRQVDWLLADAEHVPEGSDGLYVEKVLRLPLGRFCYRPPADAPEPERQGEGITFGCFNNLAKLNHATVAQWSELLRRVPDAQLLLKAAAIDNPGVADKLRDAFQAQGVAADRLLLEGRSPHADYLAAYARIDVALDPFPFTGGLTTLEALWMGVPVVSRYGDTFVSRQGLSILSRLSLADLAVATSETWLDVVGGLAHDRSRLTELRRDLRERMRESPLCDAQGHARQLEAAIRTMVG